jgi:hypothetical protein
MNAINFHENPNKLSDSEITAHTASMWKYLPVPESPEPAPEYCNDDKIIGNCEIIAARVRGKKHKHEGTNCDDFYCFDNAGDFVIAVVSDGAGSKPFSRIGARVSSEAALAAIKKELVSLNDENPDLRSDLSLPFESEKFTKCCTRLAKAVQDSFSVAYSAVEGAYELRKGKAGFERSELSDYAATLLAAVIIPVENGEHFVISVQVGDGMIASFNHNSGFESALRILGGVASGGGFAGETEFLCAKTIEALGGRTKIQRGKITSLMLMTDGVADDYYPNDPNLLRLYTDLLLNGILDFQGESEETDAYSDITPPKPEEYPWVNDSSVSYPIQYSKNVAKAAGCTPEKLWEMRFGALLRNSAVGEGDISKSEKLKVWLDNYIERGSFDDRTLVVINIGEAV